MHMSQSTYVIQECNFCWNNISLLLGVKLFTDAFFGFLCHRNYSGVHHFDRHPRNWYVRQNQVFPFVLRGASISFLSLFPHRGHSSLNCECSRFEGILIKCFSAQRRIILRNVPSSSERAIEISQSGHLFSRGKREKNRSLPLFGTSQMDD